MSVHACAGLSDGSCNPVCESDNEASAYFNEWASEANTYYRWFTIIADILGIGDVGGAVLTGYKGLAKLIQKIMSEEGIVGIAVAALTIETLIVADAYATIANAASQLSSLYTNQLSNTGGIQDAMNIHDRAIGIITGVQSAFDKVYGILYENPVSGECKIKCVRGHNKRTVMKKVEGERNDQSQSQKRVL